MFREYMFSEYNNLQIYIIDFLQNVAAHIDTETCVYVRAICIN